MKGKEIVRKGKIQNMTTDQLVKRLAYLKSKQLSNKKSSNQMKYISYHLKKRGRLNAF